PRSSFAPSKDGSSSTRRETSARWPAFTAAKRSAWLTKTSRSPLVSDWRRPSLGLETLWLSLDGTRLKEWLGLTPRAILAHRFLDQRIKLVTPQSDLVCHIVLIVAGDRQLGRATGRGDHSVPHTGGHELGDFLAREELGRAGILGSQRNFCRVLDRLH